MDCIKTRVRLLRAEINDFMNIEHGIIDFTTNPDNEIFADKSDILGIYGQNGSGKTALVRLLKILDSLLSGTSLPERAGDYITINKDTSSCAFEFSVSDKTSFYRVFYSFTMEKRKIKPPSSDAFSVFISSERLQYKGFSDGKWSKRKTLIDVHISNNDSVSIKPKNNRLMVFGPSKQSTAKLNAFAVLAVEKSKSYLFSREVIDLVIYQCKKNNRFLYSYILLSMKRYALLDLYIIDNSDMGLINLNIMLPLNMKTEDDDGIPSITQFMLRLDSADTIPKEKFNLVCACINNINKVLESLIPDMRLKLEEIGSELSKDNKEMVTAELLSIRHEQIIPLKYESDGIKKIISVLSTLIAVHNIPYMTVVIDEFDSGIFEYLLGEILSVLERFGKGQLIFTSHNLRPLEVLNKNDIVFTTTNKANRYIRLKNVKQNNNLRDLYYRSIILSGQNEEVYDQTSDILLEKAFRSVGDNNNEC